MWSSHAQCLNGGCQVGLSKAQTDNGVFIGHYENGNKQGLGITYTYNPDGTTTSYADYMEGEKNSVEYIQTINPTTQVNTHTFQNYYKGTPIYPALRITKEGKKMTIEAAFANNDKWIKYEGKKTIGELKVATKIHDGTPTFIAMNKQDQVMAVSTTVNSISLLSSDETEKYYNPLQFESRNNRLTINIFPKMGTDETIFRANIDWDMKHPDDGLWLYKKYFDSELSYKFTYEEVLDLPSAQEIKQQKLQKAFDFIAEQVEDYDFEKGYEGKAKDFIDMLKDIKERAERKGLTISNTYDITMIRLHLQNGDKDSILKFAQTACIKSSTSYDLIKDLITTQFVKHADLLPLIKQNQGLATSDN